MKSEKETDLQEIIKVINKKSENKLTKVKLFNLLSEFTYKHYSKELGDIKKIFPDPISNIKNWEILVLKKESNIGKEIEQVITNYAKASNIEVTPIRGKGIDLMIGNRELEVKSSSRNRINTMLQTSFYKNNPNKFYAFINNTATECITIRIVSSQLLYQLSLGEEILTNTGLLNEQIKTGLNKLDFPHLIETSLIKGESADVNKSFYVGKDIKIRFSIYIEPK
jgi:hypothetical protein